MEKYINSLERLVEELDNITKPLNYNMNNMPFHQIV